MGGLVPGLAAAERSPDEGWLTRGIVVAQLLTTTVAVAAAISATRADELGGVFATAALGLGISALYLSMPRCDAADRRLVAVPVAGSAGMAAAVLLSLVLPRTAAVTLGSAVGLAFLTVVFGWYLRRLTRNRPVEPRQAGNRHGQLFLVLMGLSFLKVAFATDPKYGVEYPVVIGAFAAGFAPWSIYVGGVLPLGFPVRAGPQRSWLIAQLGLALGITVAAAKVTALPPSAAGTVTVTGAVLEGGALAAVMAAFAAFAVLAVTAQRPAAPLHRRAHRRPAQGYFRQPHHPGRDTATLWARLSRADMRYGARRAPGHRTAPRRRSPPDRPAHRQSGQP